MSRAEGFEQAFNELDRFLRRELERRNKVADRFITFSQILQSSSDFNATIRNRKRDIMEMADLRNAIVHMHGRNGVRYIAEPHPEVLEEFVELVEMVVRPKTAYDISSENLYRFSHADQLGAVLAHMKDGRYSQVVVQNDGPLSIISTAGITNWLEHHVVHGIVEIEGVILSAVLEHEPVGSFSVIARNTPLDEIRELFTTPPTATTERVQAVIVTNSGRSNEKAIGIVTPWDIVS